MADMYGAVRSNWFQVKDADAFKKWFEENVSFGGEVELWEGKGTADFAFGGYEMYPSAWPKTPMQETEDEKGNYVCIDSEDWDLEAFAAELRLHLAEHQVLTVVAAGNEKLRYVSAGRLVVSHTECKFEDWYAGN